LGLRKSPGASGDWIGRSKRPATPATEFPEGIIMSKAVKAALKTLPPREMAPPDPASLADLLAKAAPEADEPSD